ncbi:unnamed protein product [Rotaria magnacalcarata]|uniref:F-box domain-containing protein n=1 Tax=Rotaria magnacalcarata TaxID=392030 RepID=A0A816Y4E7_9BILA|nr:unnamed protein product [Rotaria magnacalcarata]
MSAIPVESLLTLPTELLYLILDQLDTNDILFSFRNVCTQFRAITDSYNRYKINLNDAVPKTIIRRIRRSIRLENIASLNFSSSHSMSNKIKLFFSRVGTDQLLCLRSLKVCGLIERDLNVIMHHITTISTLASLSLAENYRKPMSADTIAALSSVIALQGLHNLVLHVDISTMNAIVWPDQCTIRQLIMRVCNHNQLHRILRHSPNLQTIVLNNCNMTEISEVAFSDPYIELNSLTLDSNGMSIDQIESLLSLLPSLLYLKLTSYNVSVNYLRRFSQWEQFIRHKLPLLKEFKFYIHNDKCCHNIIENIESFIDAFRTPFWLENKRWFVTLRCIYDGLRSNIILYSSQDSCTNLSDHSCLNTISYVISTTIDHNAAQTNTLWSARLNLTKMMNAVPFNEAKRLIYHNLYKITQLVLDITDKWPLGSLELLLTLINLSQLTEIHLFISETHVLWTKPIHMLLEQAFNVHTFGISYADDLTPSIMDISSMVFRHVDHLIMQTKNIDCISAVLDCFDHLSSVTFVNLQNYPRTWAKIIEQVNKQGNKYSLIHDDKFLQVLFDKDLSELSKIEQSHKRIKSSHYQQNP